MSQRTEDLRKLGRRLLEPLAYRFDLPVVRPSNVAFSITNRCNSRCPTCAYWRNSDPSGELDRKQIAALLQRLRVWLGPFLLGLSGGEPFMRPDVFDVMRECHRLGIRIALVTNGLLLTPPRIAQIRDIADLPGQPLDCINISMNHLDPKLHGFTRGIDVDAEVLFRPFRDLNYPGRPFRLGVSTIVMGHNVAHIPEMIRWTRDQGLDGITLQALYSVTGDPTTAKDWHESSPFWSSPPSAIDRAFEEMSALKMDGAPLTNSLEQLHWMKRFLHDPSAEIPLPCLVGVTNMEIEPNGDVYLCALMPPVGNACREELPAIWRSLRARKVRRQIRECSQQCRIKTCNFRKSLITIVRERFRSRPHY